MFVVKVGIYVEQEDCPESMQSMILWVFVNEEVKYMLVPFRIIDGATREVES